MEWVEFTARTLEEAKDMALDRLGVAADDAEFEILAEPKPGLFGRLRGEAACEPVSARPRLARRWIAAIGDPARPKVATVLPKTPKPKSQDCEAQKAATKPGAKPAAKAAAPAQGRPVIGDSDRPENGEQPPTYPRSNNEVNARQVATRPASSSTSWLPPSRSPAPPS